MSRAAATRLGACVFPVASRHWTKTLDEILRMYFQSVIPGAPQETAQLLSAGEVA